MYNLIRNSTLTGLYVYGSYMFLGDVTDSIIAGLVISGGSILFETLLGLNTHQNSFAKLREKTKHNLDSFDDDGAHLPSLYNFLKNKAGAKLIDKDIYLGDIEMSLNDRIVLLMIQNISLNVLLLKLNI